MPHICFASDFPVQTYARWRSLAESSLLEVQSGACLIAQTADGIPVEPVYPRAQRPPALLLQAEAGPWIVAQRMDHPDAARANEFALADLNNGANGLVLVGAGTPAARGFGLSALTTIFLGHALRDVSLGPLSVRLDAGQMAGAAADAFRNCVEGRGLPVDGLNVDFGIDPLGSLARTGGAADMTMLDAAARLAPAWTGSRAVIADGRPYHEAGASQAQELAYTLATALFYLRAFEKQGLALNAARRFIGFLLVADTDVFLTLAKFRALRFLWACLEESCGLTPLPIRLHAETGWRMMTRRDPHLNIVRGTIAAFAAALGGADAIAVLPFTLALGLPDAAARRIARNTQTILQAEARLSPVADPAAGAGAFESLTQSLCAQAWKKFQAIETAGGMLAALTRGDIPRAMAAMGDGPAGDGPPHSARRDRQVHDVAIAEPVL